ncbi:MAG: glutamate--tRNA ligase [Myxococcaceae bacterium]|nr:glutamate--tRNA ligase [Myxococcaceae bacterium]MBH2006860.1 glutamate--tRNA ligase [Myxococcaceae bacterium]
MEIRVRIGPSPTGDPHVGTGYVSLFNYAFAKQQGGKFILRIEDTDQKRSTPESEQAILSSIKWLGIQWDEGPDIGGPCGPYRQSERLPIYKEHVEKLISKGHAYWCSCTPERLAEVRKRQLALKQPTGYDGHCRALNLSEGLVIRLKTPQEGETVFRDLLRGEISIGNSEIDDQVLFKSDGFPTYHLANVVDDHLMRITHVIRGEEWISSTPKHILLYRFFGWEPPQFAHLPLLRNADKSKVSKRKNPVSLEYFREAGYLPDALLNFLGLMAFSFEEGREIFSLSDFVQNFKLERISLGGPVFDLKKLLWLNGRYLRENRNGEQVVAYLQDRLFSTAYLNQIVPLVKERVEKSEDFIEYADFFFKASVLVEPENYLIKGVEDRKKLIELYEELIEQIEVLRPFDAPSLESALRTFCEQHQLKPKDVFMPVRLMATGKKATPPLFETLAVLGRERCRTRLRAALGELKK